MTQTSRRRFVAATAVGAAALTIPAPLNAQQPTSTDSKKAAGWIDAHVHVWTPDLQKYPLDKRYTVEDMQPPSFTASELLSHCREAGVERVVLVQMNFYGYDHQYLYQVMQDHPGVFSGIAQIDVNSPDLLEQVDILAAHGIRGFRLHSIDDNDTDRWVGHPGMERLWRTAGEMGLAICPLINPSDIGYVEALCEKFPDTTVVVDHFARIGVSGTVEEKALEQLCQLARFANTHVKVSAFYALGAKASPYDDLIPMIRRVFDAYGPERLMWGSDCPYQVQQGHNYQDSIALIRDRIDFLSASDKDWLLRDTAEKLFFS